MQVDANCESINEKAGAMISWEEAEGTKRVSQVCVHKIHRQVVGATAKGS
jgi:hypothetical protein